MGGEVGFLHRKYLSRLDTSNNQACASVPPYTNPTVDLFTTVLPTAGSVTYKRIPTEIPPSRRNAILSVASPPSSSHHLRGRL